MKKMIILMLACMPFISCVKQNSNNELAGNWNGYEKFLKTGEMVHTLWAGKNINAGTVTYGLDNNANFYVTYDCSASGWLISETHMFAGDKALMPLNKPGAPKIGLFPNSAIHNPRVSSVTYRIPLSQLPPCALPGFVVASHAVVRNPSGRTETAWAEGDYTFSDKGWGWYDSYYYDPPADPLPVLYATAFTNDTLKLYHVDISTGVVQLMLAEFVGNSSGTYDGAAYDEESGLFFFTNFSTGELWINDLQGEEPSFCAGLLEGQSASGCFLDQTYYYVNDENNTINVVYFDDEWQISGIETLDTIPDAITVNDIDISPDGDILYILGHFQDGNTELITWNDEDENFFSTSVMLDEDAQIAFGSDGVLYALSRPEEDPESNYVYAIDLECFTLTEIEDVAITIGDPFSDLSKGPAQ